MRHAGRALVLLLTAALFLSLPGLALAVDEANMDQLAIDLGQQTVWPAPFLTNFASWPGVTSIPSGSGGRNVTSILLVQRNLTVTFPSTTFNELKNLVTVDLSRNQFVGCGLSDLARFSSLVTLNITEWKMGAADQCSVPPFWTSPSLQTFSAESANLMGALPTATYQCSQLAVLSLRSNALSGVIPWSSLTALTSFVSIDLARNSFSPHSLNSILPLNKSRSLSTIRIDTISDNFAGTNLPDYGFTLSVLDLSAPNATGGLLRDNWARFSEFGNLTVLNLFGNPMLGRGQLPNANQMCSGVTPTLLEITLAWTNGTGGSYTNSSRCLNNAARMRLVDLTGMGLSGPYPDFVRAASLITLRLGANSFNGSLPTAWGGLRLQTIDLSDMATPVPMPLPAQIAAIPTLRELRLRNAGLVGVLPNFLLNISLVDVSQNPGLRNCTAAGSVRVCGSATNIKLDAGQCLDVCPPPSGCPLPPPEVPLGSPLPVCNGTTWLIGNIVNNGTSVTAVNSSAPLEVVLDYTQDADAVLVVYITDLNAPLVVGGNATVDGGLEVTLTQAYTTGVLIPILSAGNLTGNFSSVTVRGPCIASTEQVTTESGLFVFVTPDTTSSGCTSGTSTGTQLPTSGRGGLTSGQKVAIIVGCVAFALAVLIVIVLVILKKAGAARSLFHSSNGQLPSLIR